MDITMCTSSTCQNREQCYRAMAKPDKYQSYADFTKLCAEKDYQCMWVIKGWRCSCGWRNRPMEI